MPTPVGDEPRRDGRGDSPAGPVPGRRRRPHSYPEVPGAEAVTVEQLIARTGTVRGERRHHAAHGGAQDARPQASAARPGFPPVPAADRPAPGRGLPPVPAADRPTPPGGLPPVPRADQVTPRGGLPSVPRAGSAAPRAAAPPEEEVGRPAAPDQRTPARPSAPIPPLPWAPGRSEPAKRRRQPRALRPPTSPARRRLVRTVGVLVLVVALAALYHLGLYFYVDHSMGRVHALATDGPEVLAPQVQAGNQNYLLVGTGVPGQRGAGSVAPLLVSISKDGRRAVLVSIPPTALVDTPECRTESGALRPPTSEAFASALLAGGPSCMVRAVQQISGVRIDHYLAVDLARLPGMVDSLGGVPICAVPSPAQSAAAAPLPAGRSTLSGSAATGYLRPADAKADVTGAAVAERAELLLTSTLRAAMSRKTLTNTYTLTRFLVRASGALTVDDGTTLGDLRSLAGNLGRLTGTAVQRGSLPVAQPGYVPAGGKDAYVILDRTGTRTLFDAVIGQTRLPPQAASGAAASAAPAPPGAGDAQPSPPPAPPAGGQGPTVPPDKVAVDVLNGTGVSGLAGTVADALRHAGFAVGAVGNEPGAVSQTVVRYGPGAAEPARTVAAAVPGSVLQAADSLGDKVQLVIGPGYSNVVPVQIAAAQPVSSAAPPTTAPPKPVTC